MIAFGELKRYKGKALISGDKGIELTIFIIANTIDANEIHRLLHKPLKFNIEVMDDEIAGENNRAPQIEGCSDSAIMG